MQRNTFVGLGEALWDMLPEGKKLGGAPANFAFHAAQLGAAACVASAVGRDSAGDELLASLAQKGLDCLVARTDSPTGTVDVEVDAQGIPSYHIRKGVAWDYIPFGPRLEQLARHTQAVCFGSLAQRHSVSRNSILRFLDAMPHGDRQCKIFDINLRQDFFSKEILHDSLLRCNILKINDEELDTVSRLFGMTAAGAEAKCRQLLSDYALEVVILTCGTQGSFVFTPSRTSFFDTPKVEVADTVGAGDAFTAAFAAAHLAEMSVVEAHRLAVDVSAYVCTQHGAMPALPQTLKQRIPSFSR